MKSAALRHDIERLPTIRKVFRQGNQFICGICRTKHDSEKKCVKCLGQCWLDVLALSPVVQYVFRNKLVFKCRFCCRKYTEEASAQSCADECRGNRDITHKKDMKIYGMPLDQIGKRKFDPQKLLNPLRSQSVSRFNFVRGGQPQMVVPRIGSKTIEADESIPVEADESTEAEMPMEEPKKEVPRRHRSEFKKEWFRKDAKYECGFCHELYFTRLEVEQCFGGHFDEEGLEILADGDEE